MSNAGVVAAISKLLQRFEAGELSATAVEDQMEGYVSALEGLRGSHLMSIRNLTGRLVHASFADEEYPGEDPKAVLEDIKMWLNGIPR